MSPYNDETTDLAPKNAMLQFMRGGEEGFYDVNFTNKLKSNQYKICDRMKI